jgi:hypothetical protein
MKCRNLLGSSVIWCVVLVSSWSAVTGFAEPAPAVPGLAEIPLILAEPAAEEPPASEENARPDSGLPFDWQAWAVVLVAVAVLVGIRLVGRRKEASVPADVFELLGEATLGNGQPVRIVRFGPKTLLIASGSSGPMTLSELDDPLATEWIAAACRGEQTLRVAKGYTRGGDATAETPVAQGQGNVRAASQSQGLFQPEVA